MCRDTGLMSSFSVNAGAAEDENPNFAGLLARTRRKDWPVDELRES